MKRTLAMALSIAIVCGTLADAKPRKAPPRPTVAPEYARVVKPTAVLLNGAGQYQPGVVASYVSPLAPLGSDLEAQGWRVVFFSHLDERLNDEEPVLVVGHSAGGAAALDFAKRMVEQAKFHPTVIMFDAAPWWGSTSKCQVKTCINLRTTGYPKIAGAFNVDAASLTDVILPHVTVAFSQDARKVVLQYTKRLVRP